MTEGEQQGFSGEKQRRLEFQGAVNFRDLGGYRTVDGRQVRWGKLFRSDQLAEITDEDLMIFHRLGIKTLCDLRAESERLHKPNRCLTDERIDKNPGPNVYALGFMPHQGDELIADTRAGKITVAEIGARVEEIYRRFARDQLEAYSQLIHLVSCENLPLLIHCTSGRDRTGFASAILLSALGVPRNVIIEDYMLSDQYRRDLAFQIGGDVAPEIMAALTQAKPEYLQASFAAIDKGWGSFEGYLRDGLGINPQRLQQMQELLLEP